MKAWEENWTAFDETGVGQWARRKVCITFRDGVGVRLVGEAFAIGSTMSELEPTPMLTRATLAAAAPDMARALLDVEWVRVRLGLRVCPSCENAHPDDAGVGSDRTPAEALGHDSDCLLNAALRKAGVR